jgi:hypothetical protein
LLKSIFEIITEPLIAKASDNWIFTDVLLDQAALASNQAKHKLMVPQQKH